MATSARKTAPQKKAAMRELRRLLQNPQKDLLWYHKLGQQAEVVHPTRGGRSYGEGVMRELASELGQRESYSSTLLMARRFAKEYPGEEVERLSNPRNNDGYSLSWTHVQLLLSLERADRLEIQKQCIAGRWPYRELHRRLKEFRGRSGQGGRRHEQPETLEEALRQLVQETEVWRRRYERVWFSESGVINNAGRSSAASAATRKLLDEAIAALKEIGETVPGDLKRLQQFRRRLGRKGC